MEPQSILWIVLLLLVVVTFFKGFGLNQEYQRAVVYRLGRLQPPKGPGIYWLIPWLDRAVKVDIRTMTVSLPTQETVTKDGVAVKVNATLWHQDFRSLPGGERGAGPGQRGASGGGDGAARHHRPARTRRPFEGPDEGQRQAHGALEKAASKWGVEIDAVEIRDMDIPEQMQRALAREAEATREAKARLIKAQGEKAASFTLVEAAREIAGAPAALELRRLQTLTEDRGGA